MAVEALETNTTEPTIERSYHLACGGITCRKLCGNFRDVESACLSTRQILTNAGYVHGPEDKRCTFEVMESTGFFRSKYWQDLFQATIDEIERAS